MECIPILNGVVSTESKVTPIILHGVVSREERTEEEEGHVHEQDLGKHTCSRIQG